MQDMPIYKAYELSRLFDLCSPILGQYGEMIVQGKDAAFFRSLSTEAFENYKNTGILSIKTIGS